MGTIDADQFVKALGDLLEEGHVGAPDPKSTWMTSNEPDSGFLGTLSGISAEVASRVPAQGMNTIAAHTEHLRYSLSLANRAFRGENPYPHADWPGSWRTQTVDATAWDRLRDALRHEHEQLLAGIRGRVPWDNPMVFHGAMALVGHGAYHLGAIRQIRRLLTGIPPTRETSRANA
jgi:hypothetical protein